MDRGVQFMQEWIQKMGVTAPCICHRCIEETPIMSPAFPQMKLNATVMILCLKCGNKRCPHASDHRNECTGSNDPGQAGSVYQEVSDMAGKTQGSVAGKLLGEMNSST